MALPSSIESSLGEAGFSATEVIILNRLLEDDAVTLRQLAMKTGKSTGVLDQAMKKLAKKKIIAKEDINGVPKYILGSLQAVVQWMEKDMKEKREQLTSRHQDFESFIASLTLDKERPEIQHFTGLDGIRQAYMTLLAQGKELLVYAPVIAREEDDPLREFHVQFFRMRRQKEVFCRVIAHDTPLGRRYQSRDAFEYRKTMLIPDDSLPLLFERVMAGTSVACIDHERQTASILHFPDLARAERATFEFMWRGFSMFSAQGILLPEPPAPPVPWWTKVRSQVREFFLSRRGAITIVVCAVIAAGITAGLYGFTANLATQRIRDKVQSIATTGALQFDARELDEIHTLQDAQKPVYKRIAQELQTIRAQNDLIRYVYIIRPTPWGETVYEFVADADSIDPYTAVDASNDGIIDPNDPADEILFPGHPYDVSHIETLRKGITNPTSTDKPYSDQWGTVYTGYAPVKNDMGEIVAILAVDMEASVVPKLNTVTSLAPYFLVVLFCLIVMSLFGFMRTGNGKSK